MGQPETKEPALAKVVRKERDRSLYHRITYLPEQLRAARKKVEMLEREAARLGIEVAE